MTYRGYGVMCKMYAVIRAVIYIVPVDDMATALACAWRRVP